MTPGVRPDIGEGAANRSWQVRGALWQFLREYLRSLSAAPGLGYEAIWAATVLEKVVSRV